VALGRRLRPPLMFVWNRLTPGGSFGLEYTSVLAVLAVGLYVVVAYSVVLSGDPGPTPGDMTAQDVADSLQMGWLTDVAKAVTHLGSGAVVFPLAAACAVMLGVRRRWTEFWVLVGGMTITILAVHDLKGIVDRPRPAGGAVDAQGSSFPSGHAAYATLYSWIAITVALRLRRGKARASAIVAAGLTLTALVGLTRVYLGAHYLSDVSGGWALGASAFSLCAAIALIVTRFRQNQVRAGSA
jgi:membrane-associated phospholipid phosphatase